MEVISCNESFGGRDDPVAFEHTRVIFQRNGQTYQGLSKRRYKSKSDVTELDLYNKCRIPIERLEPTFEPQFTTMDHDSNIDERFIKRQRLSSYNPQYPDQMKLETLDEVRTCEFLRKHPHPNIAVYHGCEVNGDRITGLCFTRYDQTLLERVNPGHYNKRHFSLEMRSKADPRNASQWFNQIEGGIRHLHSLGIVHNDINPSNIMFDGDIPILIDFGSCRPEGSSLCSVGRTYEWYDDTVREATPSNDLDALQEMRSWLGGDVDALEF
ncbi:hypothetical protein FE257_011606 [Aspergillus nanangensis]|uniref:Protein kinase domain-containing protein n=1 Tax=Aspergillus nanangensis TaxID=2582783 RepID=A0AAD4CVE0_ASPNN|nr:hypothetical protein FE257_011606 [Aspergillus nanangensis]